MNLDHRWQDEILEHYRRHKRAEQLKRAGWLFAFGSLFAAAGVLVGYVL